MSTPLHFGIDNRGKNAYAPLPATDIFTSTLVNGAPASITIPTSSKYWTVSFSYTPGCSVWVDFSGATAVVPAGATFASSTSELNPAARLVVAFNNDGTSRAISLVTSNASCGLSVAFYESAGQ